MDVSRAGTIRSAMGFLRVGRQIGFATSALVAVIFGVQSLRQANAVGDTRTLSLHHVHTDESAAHPGDVSVKEDNGHHCDSAQALDVLTESPLFWVPIRVLGRADTVGLAQTHLPVKGLVVDLLLEGRDFLDADEHAMACLEVGELRAGRARDDGPALCGVGLVVDRHCRDRAQIS